MGLHRSAVLSALLRLRAWSNALPLHAIFALMAALAWGCTPAIGDKCTVSTDCSTRGDRLCDNSQPEGYCTVFNCRADSCPDKAACLLFNSALGGCAYDDRAGAYGSRLARSFCGARCETDSDCRSDYVCVDPRTPPWSALILDDDQGQRTCLPRPVSGAQISGGGASVCPGEVGEASPIEAGLAEGVDSGVVPSLVETGVGDAGTD